jgi:hypothetical protein
MAGFSGVSRGSSGFTINASRILFFGMKTIYHNFYKKLPQFEKTW